MPINPDSSTRFANEPLISLVKKPLHAMSQDELRQYTLELRTLAKSPQALGKKLRQEAKDLEGDEDEADELSEVTLDGSAAPAPSKPVKARKEVKPKGSLDDLMKELGG